MKLKNYLIKFKVNYKTLLVLPMMAIMSQANAQCPLGDVALTSQAEVNQFLIDYPNCTIINGLLQIGANISDPSGDITDLSPLGNITQVNDHLYIQNNAILENVDGLNITTVQGFLYIGGDEETRTNHELKNLDGLSSLTSVENDIYINYNQKLNDISGLQNTTFNPFQGYGLTIHENPMLAVCDLPNFCAYLANDPATHPREISGNLAECINEQAVLDACNTVVDTCTISSFPFEENFEADSPSRACWTNEYVSGNYDWTYQTGGVNGATVNTAYSGTINAVFNVNQQVNHTTKLVSPKFDLTGITSPKLTFWYANQEWFGDQNELRVYYKTSENGAWTLIPDAVFMENITEWTDIDLDLPSPGATYYIAFEGVNNWTRGILLDDVSITDGSLSVGGVKSFDFTYYPNPVKDILNISHTAAINTITIINMLGQTVLTQNISTENAQINLSDLPKGNYFVKATSEGGVKTIKIVKQ